MKLKNLIAKLENVSEKNKKVRYDFDDVCPTHKMCSYRGFYEDLSLGVDNVTIMEVWELLKMLKYEVGKVEQGYKGGDFVMHENVEVWVSPYGECSGLRVWDVEERPEGVIIHTFYDPYRHW